MIASRICLLWLIACTTFASPPKTWVHRSFWQPTYLGQRLDYCTVDHKQCGLAVADCFCKAMGYPKASGQLIANNVGLTHYFGTTTKCIGWRCNGFKTIQCSMQLSDKPPKPYHYRFKRFYYPRYNHYRVDWCYDGAHQCGRRAAYSFCRRMGYLQTRGYRIDRGIAATQAIGNQKLCFGKACNAFAEIRCYR